MTPIIFIQLPGLDQYVAVHRIISWGPAGPVHAGSTKVRIEGQASDTVVHVTPARFSEYIATKSNLAFTS